MNDDPFKDLFEFYDIDAPKPKQHRLELTRTRKIAIGIGAGVLAGAVGLFGAARALESDNDPAVYYAGNGAGGAQTVAPEAGKAPAAGSTKVAPAPTAACEKWGTDDDTRAELKSAVTSAAKRDITDRGIAPGATIVVGCGPKILAETAVGTTDNSHRPSVEATAYDLSSVSKHITALGILALVDEHKLSLNDPIGEYLPEWDSGTKKQVTFGMLLRHQSGLVDPPSYDPLLSSSESATWSKVLNYPLTNSPGSADSYSNIGFAVAYKAASAAAGEPLEQVVNTNIFKPLGLKHAGWSGHIKGCAPTSLDADPSGTVTCYSQDRLTRALGGVDGHAGYIISAGDLAKIMSVEANSGMYGSKKIFSKQVLAQLGKTTHGHGHGVGTSMNTHGFYGKDLNDKTYGHTGWNGTEIMKAPDGLWSVILTNGTYHKAASEDAIFAANQDINNTLATVTKP